MARTRRFGVPLGPQSSESAALRSNYVSSPQYACMRSIAHELLLTLEKYAAWSFTKPYRPQYAG
jgi:hypothetical protein